MRKSVALLVSLLVLLTAGFSFAALDNTYKSYEIQKDGSMKFRLNIPLAVDYMKRRADLVLKQYNVETVAGKKKQLWGKFIHYTNAVAMLEAHPKIKAICVFGPFNSWTTFSSDIPNRLIPSSKNPDTWYTLTNVPMATAKTGDWMQYKFVIDLDAKYIDGEGKPQDYLYVEDPINTFWETVTPKPVGKTANVSFVDDGFDGYNSRMIYTKP
jgi:hypothetical protein